jgi:nicotinamidase/pyrazinamidase
MTMSAPEGRTVDGRDHDRDDHDRGVHNQGDHDRHAQDRNNGEADDGRRARRRSGRRALLKSLAGGGLCAALPLWPRSLRAGGVAPDAHSALIIVDVQNCFVTGGSLAVAHGEDVVPVINRLAPHFANIVVTQDWHTPGHVSFASSHPGRKPFETLALAYGEQVLWPDHCVMGTDDAALYKGLDTTKVQVVIRKGFHRDLDSYSAFDEADHKTATGLAGYLEERRIRRLFVCGLATDFCVAWTAIDARAAGFDTYVIEDACRAIDLHGSLAAAWRKMAAVGVRRMQSAELA